MAGVFDIPEFKAGQDVRDIRDQLNRLRRAIIALQPCDSADIKANCTERGTTHRLARRPIASESTHPFLVVDASTESPAAAKVTVIFGQVNSLTPTIATVALDTDPAPTLTVITGVVYLKVNLDANAIATSVEVLNAASLPASTATEGYITLATLTVAANAITALDQSVTHSLQFLRCNDQDVFGAV
jgi:hypothetical protein